jgi:hypothetical protein
MYTNLAVNNQQHSLDASVQKTRLDLPLKPLDQNFPSKFMVLLLHSPRPVRNDLVGTRACSVLVVVTHVRCINNNDHY